MTPNLQRAINSLPIIALAVFAIYAIAFLTLPGNDVRRLINSIMLCAALGVVISYSSGLRDPKVPYDSRLLLGAVVLGWIGTGYVRLQAFFQTSVMGLPERTTLDTPLEALGGTLGFFLLTCAAFGHLIAPESVAGRIPTKNWLMLGRSVAGGVFIFVVMTWFM